MTEVVERPPEGEQGWRRILGKVEMTLAAIFLTMIFIGVIWQVIGRYAPEVAWAGAGEIARYSLMAMTFIMTGYLIGNSGQITVSVIDNVVKGRGLMFARILSALLMTVICAWMTYAAWELVSTGFGRTTAVTRIPLAYMFLLPLIGGALGTIRAIVLIVTAHRPEVVPPSFEEEEAR